MVGNSHVVVKGLDSLNTSHTQLSRSPACLTSLHLVLAWSGV